jgi:hypothetical protein
VWNIKNETATHKDRGKWNRVEIIQKISYKRTWKAERNGTTENSHTGHCARTAGSTDVKVHDVCYGK